jgi:hypothetical protein
VIFKNVVAAIAVVGFGCAGIGTTVAGAQTIAATSVLIPVTPAFVMAPKLERPAILPALYVSLAAVQAWDVYSTRSAIGAGAREANPIAAPFTGNVGSMLGLKLATTATAIVLSERLWKKNRVAAVVALVALNGATAAVAMHNMRVGRQASRR